MNKNRGNLKTKNEFQARRVSSQSEELNLEDELLLDDGDDDDLLRSDPEEDELSLMPENDGKSTLESIYKSNIQILLPI